MKRIICFGDSNTYGHNPKDASRLEKRWTKLIPTFLGGGYEIIEEGLCGRTTIYSVNGYIDGWEGSTTLKPILASHSPFDLLIIMLGTNDLLLGCNADAKDSAKGIETLINIAKEYTDKILIISPIEIDESVKYSEIFTEQYGKTRGLELSKQFAKEFEPVANANGCYFMDAAKTAKASALDGVHMDEENHEKLAKAISDKVREILTPISD